MLIVVVAGCALCYFVVRCLLFVDVLFVACRLLFVDHCCLLMVVTCLSFVGVFPCASLFVVCCSLFDVVCRLLLVVCCALLVVCGSMCVARCVLCVVCLFVACCSLLVGCWLLFVVS